MARTYLERHLEEFEACGREELIKHALRALKDSLSQDKELTVENTSVGVGGLDEEFRLWEGQDIAAWLEAAAGERGVEAPEAAESMEVDS